MTTRDLKRTSNASLARKIARYLRDQKMQKKHHMMDVPYREIPGGGLVLNKDWASEDKEGVEPDDYETE